MLAPFPRLEIDGAIKIFKKCLTHRIINKMPMQTSFTVLLTM